MKHSVENISDVEKKITVEIPKETIKEEIEQTYEYLKNNASIKGFRKGKIPRNVLEMHFRDQVLSDVMSKLINDTYSKSVEENSLVPVSHPKFDADKLDINKDYRYSATVCVKPDIDPQGYDGMELEKESVKVTDKDIDSVLNHLVETQSVLKPKNCEKLSDGDFAVVEITAHIDGKQLTPEDNKTQTVEMGKKMLHPEIEKALLGLEKGGQTTVVTKLDESIKDKKFAGKETEFRIKLKEIRIKETPKLDDDFARSLGPHKDINDLKDAVRDQVRAERERKSRIKMQNGALDILVEKNSFEVPPSMVDGETEYMLSDFRMNAYKHGITGKPLEDDIEKVKPQIRQEALKKVRESLLLEAIAKKEGIEALDEDIDRRLDAISKNLNVSAEQVREYYSRDNALYNLKAQIAAEKAIEFIVKKSKIKTVEPAAQNTGKDEPETADK